MKLVLSGCVLLLFAGVLGGCSKQSYVICRGEGYCTRGMTQEEAMHAAQLKKAWGDEALYVRPGQ